MKSIFSTIVMNLTSKVVKIFKTLQKSCDYLIFHKKNFSKITFFKYFPLSNDVKGTNKKKNENDERTKKGRRELKVIKIQIKNNNRNESIMKW